MEHANAQTALDEAKIMFSLMDFFPAAARAGLYVGCVHLYI